MAAFDIDARAFTERESECPWLPNWRGRAVAVVASGPSAKHAPINDLLIGKMPILAIKRSHELCRYVDLCYGCDGHWWRSVDGLRTATNIGERVAYESSITQRYPMIKLLKIDTASHDILVDTPGLVGSGGNSGFQALNLAAQAGADRILLIGLDLDDRGGTHWYGRNGWSKAGNPSADAFRRWISHFHKAASTLEKLRVDVVNASPISALKAFRHASVEATLSQWGIA